MSCEFLHFYKRLEIGDEIKIKEKFLNSSCSLLDFLEYSKIHGNQFTIKEITKVEEDVLFEVWELHGMLYYDQIEPLNKVRVVNCRKK